MRTPRTGTVVVGVNGTSAGLAAVRLGAREARARDRELRIVHAFTWPEPQFPEDDDYGTARAGATRMVDEAVATARRSTPGVRAGGEVVDGVATRVLLRASRTADLLVLGDDGPVSGVSRAGLPADSVLVQVVARSFCPAVVARGLRPPTGPLLAAIDGSPASVETLRLTAAEAVRRDVPVEVAHVVEEPGAAAEADGRRLLTATVEAVPELRGARRRLLTGDPARVLVRESRRARMMLVGPRGRDDSAPLGPVARELLTRCACPTLFVHGNTGRLLT